MSKQEELIKLFMDKIYPWICIPKYIKGVNSKDVYETFSNISDQSAEYLLNALKHKNVRIGLTASKGSICKDERNNCINLVGSICPNKEVSIYHELGHLFDVRMIFGKMLFNSYNMPINEFDMSLNDILKDELLEHLDEIMQDFEIEYREAIDLESGAGTYDKLIRYNELNTEHKQNMRLMKKKCNTDYNRYLQWSDPFVKEYLKQFGEDELYTRTKEIEELVSSKEYFKEYNVLRKPSVKAIEYKYNALIDAVYYYKDMKVFNWPGHSHSYYKRQKDALGSEFFANMFSDEISNYELGKQTVKKYLPKSYEAFYKLLNELNDEYNHLS